MDRVMDQRRRVAIGPAASDRVLRVCAAYSLAPEPQATLASEREGLASQAAAAVVAMLEPGEVGLVAGPSGSGKSSVLAHVRKHLGSRCIDAGEQLEAALDDQRAIIDALAEPRSGIRRTIETCASLLAAAGLAEPSLWVRQASTLSDGERARYTMAICFGAASGSVRAGGAASRTWITIDECCALLDDATAQSVCRTLTRWAKSQRQARVVCASSRKDLERWLAPDSVWRLEL